MNSNLKQIKLFEIKLMLALFGFIFFIVSIL